MAVVVPRGRAELPSYLSGLWNKIQLISEAQICHSLYLFINKLHLIVLPVGLKFVTVKSLIFIGNFIFIHVLDILHPQNGPRIDKMLLVNGTESLISMNSCIYEMVMF